MTIEHTPAPARSDVRRPAATTAPTRPHARPFYKRGMLITIGAVAWGINSLVLGTDPSGAFEEAMSSLTSGTFQLGLLGLLTVLFATKALGDGRLARFFIRFEAGLLFFAIGSTVADGIGASNLDQPGWAMLDMFWPLSMLGMFFIGIRIAIAGRWHGKARFWPLIAESWGPIVVPTFGLFGSSVAGVVSFVHLCVGYGVLGQIVARKEG
ncbi:hypothetical protein ASC77_02370 [Nocardioides sp. Root1257]|uniref:hypothetical protein n=1 Tax=unclassified Nocardioides TaxID=2615069 RepID=UPI0006F38943|nr:MULTISPECIES: hypothetical protein [unclassified Nocardioides]KQW53162.1 hypothetical protein ASC77_02370 [Nocardioides sp. Root1257]KRC55849.1 hypothetical protein ASE24_02370 [Nocardioides sp. Root224]